MVKENKTDAELLSERVNKLIEVFPKAHWNSWVLEGAKNLSNPKLGVEISVMDDATSRSTVLKIDDAKILLSPGNATNLRKFAADLKMRLSILKVQALIDKQLK